MPTDEVFTAARDWLGGLLPGSDLRTALNLLAGLRVCDAMLGDGDTGTRAAAKAVTAHLDDAASFDRCDPMLLHLGRRLLNDDRLPEMPADSSALTAASLSLLVAPTTEVRQVCAEVAAATAFGTTGPGEAAGAVLGEVLPTLAVLALRGHDLELGAMLLRTTSYLRVTPAPSFSRSVRFLAEQQLPNGSFGYFADEVRTLAGKGVTNTDSRLYLPTTVGCVWALGEALNPQFRLFSR